MFNAIDMQFDKDEEYIYALNEEGFNSYSSNSFGSNNFFVALTNKRVYFRGIRTKITTKFQKSDTIDLKDISSIKILSLSYPILLVFAVITFISGICYYIFTSYSGHIEYSDLLTISLLCILFVSIYLITISERMIIYYHGGNTSFSIKDISQAEVINFQKLLFIAKENAIKNEIKQKNGGNNDETPA